MTELEKAMNEVEVIDVEAVEVVNDSKEKDNSNNPYYQRYGNPIMEDIPVIIHHKNLLVEIEDRLSSTENLTRMELERHMAVNTNINRIAHSFHETVTEETPEDEFEALLYIMNNQNKVTAKLARLAKTIK